MGILSFVRGKLGLRNNEDTKREEPVRGAALTTFTGDSEEQRPQSKRTDIAKSAPRTIHQAKSTQTPPPPPGVTLLNYNLTLAKVLLMGAKITPKILLPTASPTPLPCQAREKPCPVKQTDMGNAAPAAAASEATEGRKPVCDPTAPKKTECTRECKEQDTPVPANVVPEVSPVVQQTEATPVEPPKGTPKETPAAPEPPMSEPLSNNMAGESPSTSSELSGLALFEITQACNLMGSFREKRPTGEPMGENKSRRLSTPGVELSPTAHYALTLAKYNQSLRYL